MIGPETQCHYTIHALQPHGMKAFMESWVFSSSFSFVEPLVSDRGAHSVIDQILDSLVASVSGMVCDFEHGGGAD